MSLTHDSNSYLPVPYLSREYSTWQCWIPVLVPVTGTLGTWRERGAFVCLLNHRIGVRSGSCSSIMAPLSQSTTGSAATPASAAAAATSPVAMAKLVIMGAIMYGSRSWDKDDAVLVHKLRMAYGVVHCILVTVVLVTYAYVSRIHNTNNKKTFIFIPAPPQVRKATATTKTSTDGCAFLVVRSLAHTKVSVTQVVPLSRSFPVSIHLS